MNVCRAVYCDADVQIYDDPLSALDAHVGRSVFNNVLLNSSAGKTRVLVTHALHFLPQVDYVYTVVNGRLAEEGTYAELIARDGAFSRFVREFGSQEVKKEDEEEAERRETAALEVDKDPEAERKAEKRRKAQSGKAMMQTEERNTGSVSGSVYSAYIKAGDGSVLLPLLIISLVLIQGATVLSSYWLVWWQDGAFHRPQGFYVSTSLVIHTRVHYAD